VESSLGEAPKFYFLLLLQQQTRSALPDARSLFSECLGRWLEVAREGIDLQLLHSG
jgi:hypothetical protein